MSTFFSMKHPGGVETSPPLANIMMSNTTYFPARDTSFLGMYNQDHDIEPPRPEHISKRSKVKAGGLSLLRAMAKTAHSITGKREVKPVQSTFVIPADYAATRLVRTNTKLSIGSTIVHVPKRTGSVQKRSGSVLKRTGSVQKRTGSLRRKPSIKITSPGRIVFSKNEQATIRSPTNIPAIFVDSTDDAVTPIRSPLFITNPDPESRPSTANSNTLQLAPVDKRADNGSWVTISTFRSDQPKPEAPVIPDISFALVAPIVLTSPIEAVTPRASLATVANAQTYTAYKPKPNKLQRKRGPPVLGPIVPRPDSQPGKRKSHEINDTLAALEGRIPAPATEKKSVEINWPHSLRPGKYSAIIDRLRPVAVATKTGNLNDIFVPYSPLFEPGEIPFADIKMETPPFVKPTIKPLPELPRTPEARYSLPSTSSSATSASTPSFTNPDPHRKHYSQIETSPFAGLDGPVRPAYTPETHHFPTPLEHHPRPLAVVNESPKLTCPKVSPVVSPMNSPTTFSMISPMVSPMASPITRKPIPARISSLNTDIDRPLSHPSSLTPASPRFSFDATPVSSPTLKRRSIPRKPVPPPTPTLKRNATLKMLPNGYPVIQRSRTVTVRRSLSGRSKVLNIRKSTKTRARRSMPTVSKRKRSSESHSSSRPAKWTKMEDTTDDARCPSPASVTEVQHISFSGNRVVAMY